MIIVYVLYSSHTCTAASSNQTWGEKHKINTKMWQAVWKSLTASIKFIEQ